MVKFINPKSDFTIRTWYDTATFAEELSERISLWCEKVVCKETAEVEVTGEPPAKKHPNMEAAKLRLWGN